MSRENPEVVVQVTQVLTSDIPTSTLSLQAPRSSSTLCSLGRPLAVVDSKGEISSNSREGSRDRSSSSKETQRWPYWSSLLRCWSSCWSRSFHPCCRVGTRCTGASLVSVCRGHTDSQMNCLLTVWVRSTSCPIIQCESLGTIQSWKSS